MDYSKIFGGRSSSSKTTPPKPVEKKEDKPKIITPILKGTGGFISSAISSPSGNMPSSPATTAPSSAPSSPSIPFPPAINAPDGGASRPSVPSPEEPLILEVDYPGPYGDIPMYGEEVIIESNPMDEMDDGDEVYNPTLNSIPTPTKSQILPMKVVPPKPKEALPVPSKVMTAVDTPIKNNDASSSSSVPITGVTSGATGSTTLSKGKDHVPTVILMIGMAGSGKSTLMHRLLLDFQAQKKRVYSINLDPAVRNLPYPINIDIRDTIDYKEAMKHFKLGPNGAIMTCLNLFATRFDQVLELIDKRASELDYVIIDTPGQIEVFNWSASGQIICDTLAVSYPTVVCYTVDTVRCTRPVCFMSNMMYCCSILYKTKLPFICAFNKVDVMRHDFVKQWLSDFEEFGKALNDSETTYLQSLSRSMSLALEEFYKNLNNCGVSAKTGEGMKEFNECLKVATEEYHTQYLDYLEDQKTNMAARRERIIQANMEKFEKSLDKSQQKQFQTAEPSPTLLGDILDRLD